jgi:hypothetical protein
MKNKTEEKQRKVFWLVKSGRRKTKIREVIEENDNFISFSVRIIDGDVDVKLMYRFFIDSRVANSREPRSERVAGEKRSETWYAV